VQHGPGLDRLGLATLATALQGLYFLGHSNDFGLLLVTLGLHSRMLMTSFRSPDGLSPNCSLQSRYHWIFDVLSLLLHWLKQVALSMTTRNSCYSLRYVVQLSMVEGTPYQLHKLHSQSANSINPPKSQVDLLELYWIIPDSQIRVPWMLEESDES